MKRIGFSNYKKYQSIDILPTINVDFKDKGLTIYIAWVVFCIHFEIIQTKHNVMGNLR